MRPSSFNHRLPIGLAAVLAIAVRAASAADEIHWTITGPDSVTFDWRGPEDVIQYGLTSAYGQSVMAQTPSPLPFSSPGPFREAAITGLQPGTLYHYSIGGGPDRTFRTAPPRGDSGFTVCVEGDIGDSTSYSRMPVVQSQIATLMPDFVLAVGDLTYGNIHGQEAVDQHFNDVMVWSESTAYMPAWGNHEHDIPSEDDLRNYKGRFDLPNDRTSPGSPAVSCCGEDWHWFDYGNVRFIAYPEPWSGAWADWSTRVAVLMDQAQADPDITFIVTFGHRPAYSSGHHPGSSTLRGYLDALGASHDKYVLNLNAHSHNYERTHPQNGVVHVTAGTGGASLEQDGSCLWLTCSPPIWSAFRAMRVGPVKLRFTSTGIEGAFICGPPGGGVNDVDCVPGEVVDSFTIGVAQQPDATCDGIDDDGDGEVDEDYVPLATTCGVGGCAAQGSTACVSGSVVDGCVPGAPAAADPTCDGIDEDCDGTTDEEYVPAPTTCGTGACSRNTGDLICVAGGPTDTCDPLAGAVSEICDWLDNDCDGSTDEGFGAGAPCQVRDHGCSVDGQMVCATGGAIVCDTDIISLMAETVAGGTRLSWQPLFPSPDYDIVRGSLSILAASRGDFRTATQICLADDLSATSWLDPSLPPVGGGHWYLVRGNACGIGTYDPVEPGRVGERTPEIDASPAACP